MTNIDEIKAHLHLIRCFADETHERNYGDKKLYIKQQADRIEALLSASPAGVGVETPPPSSHVGAQNFETPTPPGNQIRTAECDGKDAVPTTGQLPVGTASPQSHLMGTECKCVGGSTHLPSGSDRRHCDLCGLPVPKDMEDATPASSDPIHQAEAPLGEQHQLAEGMTSTSADLQNSYPLERHLDGTKRELPAHEDFSDARSLDASFDIDAQTITPAAPVQHVAADTVAMKRLYQKLAEEGGGNWAIDVISDVERIIATAPSQHVAGFDLPADIIESLLAIGPVEWGVSLSQPDEKHASDLLDTLRITREHFGVTDEETGIHGVYLAGTGTVLAHTGMSPNSPQHARILVGAWNQLVEIAKAKAATTEGSDNG